MLFRSVGSLGYAYLLAKEPRRALTVLEEGAKEDNLQASFWPTHPLTVLAEVYRAAGEISLATETEIGRASCRDRGLMAGVGGCWRSFISG